MCKADDLSNNLKKFFTEDMKILPAFIVIFVLNLFIFLCFKEHIFLFVDTSREVYIPWAMNNGDVLYKDIFNVYAPLGYQLNSFLTSVFGLNINTFLIAGFVNSTLILFGLFLILRLFFKNKSFFVILPPLFFIAASCVYAISQTNYIFPYSYSMVYALNAFIWALVSLLYYLKKDKEKFLYFSFLLTGICISFKYEFITFIIILLAVLFNKKVKLKTVLICLFSFFIIPFLSIICLLNQGVTYGDFCSAFNNIIKLAKSDSVKIMYSFLGFIPSIKSFQNCFFSFIKTGSFILLFFFEFAFSIYFLILNKSFVQKYKILCILLGIIFIILIPVSMVVFVYEKLVQSNAFVFNWLGIFSIILFIIYLIQYSRKDNTINEKLYLVLFISVILCSFKSIFNLSFNSYGTYFFPLLFICCLIYPKWKIKEGDIIISVMIMLSGMLYLCSNLDRQSLIFSEKKYTVENKGSFYIPKPEYNAFTNAVEYIKNNTNKDDTVLVLPEGAMINFLTDRKSNNKFYYLIPSNVEVFGNDYIISELKKQLPRYILLQPMLYQSFNQTSFCESYGREICENILKFYEQPVVYGDNFWIAIYKRKL